MEKNRVNLFDCYMHTHTLFNFSKRLLGLAAQKFISDIATDALQYSKLRQQNTTAKDRSRNPYKVVQKMFRPFMDVKIFNIPSLLFITLG